MDRAHNLVIEEIFQAGNEARAGSQYCNMRSVSRARLQKRKINIFVCLIISVNL